MSQTINGTFRNGTVSLDRLPEGVTEARVVVDFVDAPASGLSKTAPRQDQALADFLQRLDEARRLLPPAPWQTAEEAMHALREGEWD